MLRPRSRLRRYYDCASKFDPKHASLVKGREFQLDVDFTCQDDISVVFGASGSGQIRDTPGDRRAGKA